MDADSAFLENVDDAAAWEQLTSRVQPSTWQQSWAYGTALRRRGRMVERLRIMHGGDTIGIVQLAGCTALGGRLALRHALGGPAWLGNPSPASKAQALKALRQRYARLGQALLLTPSVTADLAEPVLAKAGYRRVLTGYATALLPLFDGAEAQARLLQGSWRRALNQADSTLEVGLHDAAAEPLALDEALALHDASRRRRGYACIPSSVVAQAARSGHALLATARTGGALEAFMLFMVHGTTATYQVGWSSARGRAGEAHRHLLWRALGRLRARNCRVLDLGGLNLPAGIVAFKLATGARPVTYAGTFL